MAHGRSFALLAVAGLMAAGSMISTARADGPNTGAISLSASLEMTNEYWYRGIPQEDQGIIVQPGLEVGIALFSSDDFSIDAYFGTWNSIHSSNPTGTGGGQDAWFESDWYVGISLGLPMNLWADVSYIMLYGPSSGGVFAQEINVAFGLDDQDMWGDIGLPGWTGLQPHILFGFEIDGASDYGALPMDQKKGTYMEFGIEPGFTLVDSADFPISLSMPVTVGLSPDKRYYQYADVNNGTAQSATFGFVSVGVVASMPLSFVPADFGAWELSAGVHGLFTNRDFVRGTLGAPNYRTNRVVGVVGISMEY